MQPCIDEVRARLESMLEGVAASGRFALPDIRVGVIGFRDHGSEFLTKDLGFDSDFGVLKVLDRIVASLNFWFVFSENSWSPHGPLPGERERLRR